MFIVKTAAGQQPERGTIGQLPSQTFKNKLKTPKRFSFLRNSRSCNHFSPLKLSAGCGSELWWLASNGYAAKMLHLGKTVYSQETTLTWSSMQNILNNLFFRPDENKLNWKCLWSLDYRLGFARNHLSEIHYNFLKKNIFSVHWNIPCLCPLQRVCRLGKHAT